MNVCPSPVSLYALHVDEATERLVLDVLRSGHLAQGAMVETLEAEFAALCGVRHGIAVTNGTVALVAALQALGVGPGDEVLTSPFTFAATLNAIVVSGATACFVDIDPATFNLDPAAVDAAVTARTRAIVPVHLYGLAADMRKLAALAARHELHVVEDAAQAHGAEVDGRSVGSFGVGSFSFYATKNVASGEGGMLTTNDETIADTLRVLRNEGMRTRYEYERIGLNYRLSDVHAAIALPQLRCLSETNARRRANAAYLDQGLAGIPGIVTPVVPPGRTHVFHQYTVRVTREARLDRDALAGVLAQHDVESAVYYPRVVYDYDCYRDHPGVRATPVPHAERAADEVLSLPVHPRLSVADLDRVVEVIRKALDA
jgi:dTDP-4-amino-4,6-dideoxygalactose transaminase